MSEDAPAWTIGRLVEWMRGFFESKGIDQPRLEAELLLAHVLGVERIELYLRYEERVEEADREQLRDLVRRRAAREPTRHLTGRCEFLSLEMKVTPACLIPRPETELLVEEVLRTSGGDEQPSLGATGEGAPRQDGPAIIELCTGCGCVAVSLAVRLPGCRITATDVSAEALAVARENAEAHSVAERIAWLEGDLYEALDAADVEPADWLVANPPYVSEKEWADLAPEIRDHEPREALVAGPEGTEVVERIVKGASAYLRPGGRLAVEIGAGQGAAALEMVRAARGLEEPAVRQDYAGRDRLLCARRSV